ncbi:methyl-accepting chemotaxis protein [Paraburkholderia nemoris]|uniref:methyl-accepting chemotaxis protein n=1 Tax=Paraburkholderia TaxID=1822464 RepID=UPI0038BAA7F5
MYKLVQTIKFKIILAFVVYVVLMASVGIFGAFGLYRMNSNMNESYSRNTIPISDLSDVRAAELTVRVQLRRIQAYRDLSKTGDAVARIRTALELINSSWNRYYPNLISSDKELEIAEQIKSIIPQFAALTNETVVAASAGNFDAASATIEKIVPLSKLLDDALDQDAALNMAQAKKFAEDCTSTFKAIFWSAIALLGVGVVIATGVSVYLLRAISNPLNKALDIANHIADGELETQIDVDSGGEFGQLLTALKKMDQRLSKAVHGIKASTESVTVASREIASGNTDLSSRTEEQAASLEETAASMTQLTETVKQNANNARQANTLATHATDIADTGNEAVQGMVGTIERISGSSSKISEITGVIEGIAFQTNILALNAAVEAARAGEQGRGFAVVAGEVRSLAQRSATAAKEIKELIGSSVAMIQDGSKQATAVSATMGQVKQAIKQVSDIVGEIAAASEEQSRGIEQVNQAVNQMDEVTQQNAALVEQAAAAAQSLEEQAMNLKDAVSVFKVAATGTSVSRTAIPQSKPRPPVPRTMTNGRTESAKPGTVRQSPNTATTTGAGTLIPADERRPGWAGF